MAGTVVKKSVPLQVMLTILAVILLLLLAESNAAEPEYLAEWGAEIEGGWDRASTVAKRHGFEVLYEVPFLENHYILRHVETPTLSKRSADHVTRPLTDDVDVKWAEQQMIRERVKRDVYPDDPEEKTTREVLQAGTCTDNNSCPFNDPELPNQWYIMGDSTGNVYMTQVQQAWAKGLSGKNVVITVVDDGLEYNHTDIQPNYDPEASWDLNGNDSDPMLRYSPNNENKHGTRCAGEIAMVANNSICGVGIAYNAKLGGIRLLDGNVSDFMEAAALCFKTDYIDIYSLSWGPTDDGKTVDKPHRLAQNCMEKAIKEGRGGKGVIYVLASGNGGGDRDNCNCDGYAASLYTISVSSATQHGKKPWYGEPCASTLTTTYSSGQSQDRSVVTADLYNQCTRQHSGTSASAPMAAGVIALALEANSNLTWRDVQHLIVLTSKPEQLKEPGWKKNAAGFCVHQDFGFGLMDAGDMVSRAETWKLVPEKVICKLNYSQLQADLNLPKILKSGGEVELSINTDGCKGQANEINYLEHIQFVITVHYTRRGAISVVVISPSGTRTQLLAARKYDNSSRSFHEWSLMSVHTWGENPAGVWTFRVEDKTRFQCNRGVVRSVEMILHGTKEAPFYHTNNSVFCSMDINTTTNRCQDPDSTDSDEECNDNYSTDMSNEYVEQNCSYNDSLDRDNAFDTIFDSDYTHDHSHDHSHDHDRDEKHDAAFDGEQDSGEFQDDDGKDPEIL